MAPIIEMQGVHKTYGAFRALNGIDLHVEEGEVVVVIGPSGSGKSTLIRCINQLEMHESGTIRVHGLDAGRAHDLTRLAAMNRASPAKIGRRRPSASDSGP
jgi:ABC-type polar amino acid transport system ATPase subunit